MSAEIAYILTEAPRFWQKVTINGAGACWPYVGGKIKHGYGRYGETLAHRFSWMATHGETLPDGVEIRHRCDNPPCVNPAHLIAGTHAENMRDMADRTLAPACRNGHARTPETTALTRKGHRRCLTCDREQQRARRARKRSLNVQ